MIVLLQRVSSASVHIKGRLHSQIHEGLLVFVGVHVGDTKQHAEQLAKKVAHLRMFEDREGLANLSAVEAKKDILLVSQFTLCANTDKGHRPSFSVAAASDVAEPLYGYFASVVRQVFTHTAVQEGVFGANMQVSLCNTGPYTLLLRS